MAAPTSLLQNPAVARLAGVVKHFPPVTYAFAYGSGAHHQPGLYDASEPLHSPSGVPSVGSDAALPERRASGAGTSTSAVAPGSGSSTSKPMIDFIFAVHDAHKWHEQNLQRNPEHYSWVGRLGANVVCGIAEAVGVGVHFNPLVQLDAQTTIKYGVVEASALQRDLTHWTHLYVAGRMHKPTTPLLPPPPSLEAAAMANRHHALATALVLLPPTFTEEELLRTVAGLSYAGDVRLAVGAEDPHKVARIVNGSWDALYGMYIPLLKAQRYSALELGVVGETAGGRRGATLWRQSKDPATQGAALGLLPPGLLHVMAARLGYHVPLEHLQAGEGTQREVVDAALRTGRSQRLARESLAALVRRSSTYQAAAGLLAAGGGKAVQYFAAKLAKGLRPLLAAAPVGLGEPKAKGS